MIEEQRKPELSAEFLEEHESCELVEITCTQTLSRMDAGYPDESCIYYK